MITMLLIFFGSGLMFFVLLGLMYCALTYDMPKPTKEEKTKDSIDIIA